MQTLVTLATISVSVIYMPACSWIENAVNELSDMHVFVVYVETRNGANEYVNKHSNYSFKHLEKVKVIIL